jgi:glucan phosphoethanolaminetransferase (alkaline phosphatase superfamily)
MNEPSIIKIISAARLESSLLTNHSRRGSYNDFISTIFKDATRKRYLASDKSGKYYDANLVPLLEEELNRQTNSARLIVLHLYGSHFKYDSRYPSSHGVYNEGTEKGKYLNSVAYTDHVLGMMLDLIFTSEKEIVFLYVSDHGEILNDYGDGSFGHGFKKLPKNRSEFEVPFIIAFNDAFLERYDSSASIIKARTLQPVSHDNISHTVLGLMGLRAEVYQPTYDLSSSQFTAHDRYTIVDLFDTFLYSDSSSFIPRVENIFAEIPLATDRKLAEGADPPGNSHQ